MKNIVLCSDGTGQTGGYGKDTNVFKIYKLVDIHHPSITQSTFYENGVGTDKSDNSKNKYLKALSGAFGFGLAANVQDLYDFLARSYDIGDQIFLFGFSRGAATVRGFTGMLNACGLLDRDHPAFYQEGYYNQDSFRAKVLEAFKLYESQDQPAQQAFKDQYAVKDDVCAPAGNLKIRFLGVWDTVSALGFPQDFSKSVEWFFSAADEISDKIWPHRFYDYKLNDSIENAYQALSIDDERTTFHPKVWNEHQTKGYVEQVWFAGVHSNVGGGLPRTGLSDLALAWMIAKAEAHGLIFNADGKQTVLEGANHTDRLYASRDGMAIYYRYGPRNLTQLCHNEQSEYKLRGNIKIHASAYHRIKANNTGYAPDGLPESFDVVDLDSTNPAMPSIEHQVVIADKQLWNQLTEQMTTLINKRSLLYRIFVELTMLILIVAGYLWMNPSEAIINIKNAPTNGVFAHIADILIYFTPVYFENFIIYVVKIQPWIFITMLASLLGLRQMQIRFMNALDRVCRNMCGLI